MIFQNFQRKCHNECHVIWSATKFTTTRGVCITIRSFSSISEIIFRSGAVVRRFTKKNTHKQFLGWLSHQTHLCDSQAIRSISEVRESYNNEVVSQKILANSQEIS